MKATDDHRGKARSRRLFLGTLATGLLLATHLAAAEAPGAVRWSVQGPPTLREWLADPLPDDVVTRALSARSGSGSDKKAAASTPLFDWPIRQSAGYDDPGFWATVNFVDHDGRFPDFLIDYEGGERTYDIPSGYNHQGVDLVAWPFGWAKLGLGQVEVVAAAGGTIVARTDGNFDLECEAGFDEEREANLVGIEHEDGSIALYGHLKTGSLTAKQVGERVERGEYLGLVGSSGFSGYPHLHFEVVGAAGNLIDPFAGPFNSLNDSSWWQDQPPYYDTRLLTARTHTAPAVHGQCRRHERTHAERRFAPGDVVFLVAYFRDLERGQSLRFTIRDAEGNVFDKGKTRMRQGYQPIAELIGEFDLPDGAAAGTWTFSLEFEGEELAGSFEVGELEPVRGVRKVTPSTVAPGEQKKLKIRGFGFTRDLAVDVQRPDGVEKLIEVLRVKVKKKKITLTVLVDGSAALGTRDLVITAPDYSQLVVDDAFRVVE